ncbi:hypothetical protein DPMN_101968 [Dreissena polymorpha]|uniref:Uncharacterized protein n=1 Tax=Dreissena polymorpha TaxID=45954 RepID=A0A9D4LJU6_DREPO|nr:hypothetical protein DPMN_101968 [Dreissena polymorpha]
MCSLCSNRCHHWKKSLKKEDLQLLQNETSTAMCKCRQSEEAELELDSYSDSD